MLFTSLQPKDFIFSLAYLSYLPQRLAGVRHWQGGQGYEEAAERPLEAEGQAGTPGIPLPGSQGGPAQIQGKKVGTMTKDFFILLELAIRCHVRH